MRLSAGTSSASQSIQKESFQINGLNLSGDNFIERRSVLKQLADCVRENTITLLSSPPATGKTSLLQFYSELNPMRFDHIEYIQCIDLEDPAEAFDKKVGGRVLDQYGHVLVIIDDAQHWYGDSEGKVNFWYNLIKSTGWVKPKGCAQVRYVISATHSIATDSSSPEVFQSLPRISFNALKITDDEARQVLNLRPQVATLVADHENVR
jgi:hypothetical protein